MADSSPSGLQLSRPLRVLAITVAAVLLTSLFVYRGFPYDRLATRIVSQLEMATGMRIALGPITPDLQLMGPGLAIQDLQARLPDGESWDFQRVTLRPAWSSSWLSADPAVFIDAETPFGQVWGVATVSDTPGFDGEGRDIDLKALLDRFSDRSATIAGLAEIVADISFGPEGVEGPITLSARDGTISHPSLPMDIPYEQLDGELRFGGEALLEVLSFDIQSPMGTGSITGKVGHARVLTRAPLDLQIEITAAENIRGPLRAQGVSFGRDGKVTLNVRGTVARPVVR